jgi:hypothetical protein
MRFIVPLFIFSFSLGCGHHGRKTRLPAAEVVKDDCGKNSSEVLLAPTRYIKRKNDPHSLEARQKRSSEMSESFEGGDVKRAIDVIFESHDNNTLNFKAGSFLIGRNRKQERKLQSLRNSTGAQYVTAFFQTKKDQAVDTLSTVFQVTDAKLVLSKSEQEAIDDVRSWMVDYKEYWGKLEGAIRDGIEANFIAKKLQGKYLGESALYKASDFDNGPIDIDVPIIRQDNSFGSDSVPMESLERIEGLKIEKERLRDNIFAMNSADEYFRKSKLYQIMLEQAMIYRRLEFTYKKLAETGSHKLDEAQIALMKDIKKLLEDWPELRPRSDVVEILQKKEIKAERRAKWRFWRSKRIALDAKYRLPSELLGKISPYGIITKYMGATALLGLGASIFTDVTLPFEEISYYQYFLAAVNNHYNDFLLENVGMTDSLRT